MPLLTDRELPPLYQAADDSSGTAQRWFLNATRVRLVALVGAATFGLFVWRRESSPTDWAGVLVAICFLAALFVEAYLLKSAPERTWYEGRAAAESVKTLSWRYSVGGEPFDIGSRSDKDTDQLFLSQLDSVLEVLKDLDIVPPTSSDQQITTKMKHVRTLSLDDRKACYEQDRIQEQQGWYTRKSKWNKQRAEAWTIAMLIIELLGAVAAVIKAVGLMEGDLLIFAGTLVAVMTAWVQTKQHGTLATAYGVTALELASVRSKVAHQATEADWAKFVDDAEEAFSREHTLWKASRGVRSI